MDDLIFDRTLSDVENALNNPSSSLYLKGSYNFTDLNRVEKWGQYIQEYLIPYGFSDELIWKTDWIITDFPTRIEIDRIRQNIIAEHDFLELTNDIVINNTLDYEQANKLEKALNNVLDYLNENFYTNYSDNKVGGIIAVNEHFKIYEKEEN